LSEETQLNFRLQIQKLLYSVKIHKVQKNHATPIAVRTHTDEPVAFMCAGSDIKPEIKVSSFNEKNARGTLIEYGGPQFIQEVFFK